jgi:1-aminocyclopropane-1-carboxylate deaminase/D-cysteine desulfhydrase
VNLKHDILAFALDKAPQCNYPFQSRIHQLRSFPDGCFVKRDDELGFGVTGSKVRKFRTLIPALKNRKTDIAILIGGAFSNNILGAAQLLIENGIVPLLFLLGDGNDDPIGIHLMIRMLVQSSSIHWIPRKDWDQVSALAENKALELTRKGYVVAVIPEGSVLSEAIPGAVTLALDIIRNEKEEKVFFDQIFLDAGTGFQAAMTMLAYAWLEKTTKFSVVLMADPPHVFNQKLKDCHRLFEEWLKEKVPFPVNYRMILPKTAKSFGSVNMSVIETTIGLARSEGMFADPVYSAKLFDTARHEIMNENEVGNTLIVHSGGGLGLAGFQSLLAKKMKEDNESN